MPTQLPLTTGRVTALAIGVPVSLALIGWSALSAVAIVGGGSFQIHRSFSSASDALSITDDNGVLTLVPSGDGQVHVDGTAHYSLVRPTIDIGTTPAGASVTSSCPHAVPGPCSVDLTVAVPPRIAVTAVADLGSITASDLGNLTLTSHLGDLQVTKVSGVVHLQDDLGQITGVALGALDVDAVADNGDVSLGFAQVPGDVSVQDNLGSVTVTVPPGGPPYAVDAHSNLGNTSIGVATDPASTHVITITCDLGGVSVEPGG